MENNSAHLYKLGSEINITAYIIKLHANLNFWIFETNNKNTLNQLKIFIWWTLRPLQ